MFVLEITKVDPLRLLQKDSARRALGVLAAFLTLFALATGHRIVLAVVSAAWTLSATSALVGPTMSVRVMVMGLIGLHVGSSYSFFPDRWTWSKRMIGCRYHARYSGAHCDRILLPYKPECSKETGQPSTDQSMVG